ncbi:hygromycin-B 7''-O-kinase [Prauserella shujinwangii]|uniref:Hygromycin-B 7''-O-kinase n=1 Tax=Prauserella shujinwangii TaxID=1453103 RepID=A0A2T0LWB6_9PSEU|nr:phosphotransferase [Prauserella shujinwangii]PRX48259.1 hygromycin-B 7''-O-kinase [Prauserella shujinwangii]
MTDVPALDALRARLRLGPLERFPDGSLPVYAAGEHLALKLYPPEDAAEADTETTVLRVLERRLSVPTPAIVDTGAHEGWRYVLMRRLSGEHLDDVWPRLSATERLELAGRLGAVLAELHAVTDPAIATLGPRDWSTFVAAQRASAADRQRELGLGEDWLARIPGFLARVDLGTPPRVLLHTEFLREHLLLTHDGTRWTVTGLLDFEPAMRGAAEYEFVAVGIHLAGGDRAFLRRLLLSYGYSSGDLGEALAHRLLAYTLLHRYGNLRGYLERLPAPPRPTLEALSVTWFGAS